MVSGIGYDKFESQYQYRAWEERYDLDLDFFKP